MDRDKLAQLRLKKAENKAKLHKELLDSNSSIKQAVTALHAAINNQKPINFDGLTAQLAELKDLQTYGDDIKRLEAALKESSNEKKLDDLINAVGNINNQDVVSAVNSLITKLEAKDISQSEEDYQPVRRVRKIGQRLVFDDDPLQVNVSGGGGGGVQTTLIRNNNSLAVVNPDGTSIGGQDDRFNFTLDGKLETTASITGDVIVDNVGIENIAGNKINPATEELQTTANTKIDDVVNAVENLNINLSNQGYAKIEPTTYTMINGTYISGDIDSVVAQDNRYLIIQELSGDGLTVDFDFVLPTDKKAEEVVFKGQYNGSNSHWCDIYAYDWQQATYIMLTNSMTRFSNTNEDITVQLEVFNNHFTDASGNVKIRVKHNTVAYVSTHQLQINYVHVAYLSALDFNIEGVATEETLLKTVQTMFVENRGMTPTEDATNEYYTFTGTTNKTGITTKTITINKTTGVVSTVWS